MNNISDKIAQIIKTELFADPFNKAFDREKLLSAFGETLNEEEYNVGYFLVSCNDYYVSLRNSIFILFEKLKLSPDNLREFCFIAINQQFLDTNSAIWEKMKEGVAHDMEKTTFAKLKSESGQEIPIEYLVELSGDILAELVKLSYEWVPSIKDFRSLEEIQRKDGEKLFAELWIRANLINNLSKSAYDIVKFESGKVIIKSEGSEIKIENGNNGVSFLKKAGYIRSSSNSNEFYFNFIRLYEQTFKKVKSVGSITIQNNILSPVAGEMGSLSRGKIYSSMLLFYPHFSEVKLEYFGGITLKDLVDLLAIIEESISLILKDKKSLTRESYADVPIKFNKNALTQLLIEITGHDVQVVTKFLDSLISNQQRPYFWRKPFWEFEGHLYFSLAALAGPNYTLFFDYWTELSGYTLKQKEKLFADFTQKELLESENKEFKFDFINLKGLLKGEDSFTNNILIETSSKLILLEIKLFDVPLESMEIANVLTYLGNATFDIEEKAKKVLQNCEGKKELVKIIVSNYPNFSGLSINGIPIADLTLFKNYTTTGYIKRAAITFHEGQPMQTGEAKLYYYRNEEEFNNNLKSFFSKPIPVFQIIDRLYLKEIPITPKHIYPVFFTDMIDHVSDEELMEDKLTGLGGLLNYEYFGEPEDKVIKDNLDQSIMYSLHNLFGQLSYAPYELAANRIELYQKVSKTKMLGFAHLAFYILKELEKLNGRSIKDDTNFDKVDYNVDVVNSLIERIMSKTSGEIRLSEFKIDEDVLSEEEEKQIISFAIEILGDLSPRHFESDVLETAMLLLALLNGLSHRHELEFEFYTACSNVIDGLNFVNKYQRARDLAEEILILSIKSKKHAHGWNILFKCYTNQKNLYEASINGCLFLSSLSVLPEISHFLAVDALYGALKYYRNFGFSELAKYAYDNLQFLELSEYDKQKIALSYFNSFLQRDLENNPEILEEVISYVDNKIEDIIAFGELGVVPWLAYFYNIERLKEIYGIVIDKDIQKYIHRLENSIDPKSIESIRIKVLGSKNAKETFVDSILNVFETRDTLDFVYEVQFLNIAASNLLQASISKTDIDGVLLSGLVINDQSLTYEERSVKPGSVSEVIKPENEELKLRLNNYMHYLLSKIDLKPEQVLLWLLEDIGQVYCLILNSRKECNLYPIPNWDVSKMKELLKNLGNFYFNAKKDSEGNVKCKFSNPRAESDYNDHVQKEDYGNLLKELSFAKLPFIISQDEILIYSSINMAGYPHNLVEISHDFIGSLKPVCNIISIERFMSNHQRVVLNKDYSSSAWIPTDDQEPVISWGFDILSPVLDSMKAQIYRSTYPAQLINTDLNIFLAHGVTDSSGFKAVYSNHAKRKGIAYPYSVFGEGIIAILFICNSGSSHDSIYSNSVVSFSSELLKNGYKAVVAPFWPFDVTMSKIWLEEFLAAFSQGYSISQAVFLANRKLTEYDEATSNFFIAPAGCLAMHLYGNPNIYVGIDNLP